MSLSFNGTNSKLALTSGSLSGLSGYPFTIAAWIKPNTQSQGCVVGLSGPSTSGYFGIVADDQWGIGMCGIQANGAASWKDAAALDSANWHLLVHVRSAQNAQRTYYKSAGGTGYADDLPLNLSGLNVLEIGTRNNAAWYNGLAAHVTIWTAALTGANVVSLQGGAHPTTIQSGSLFEYWDLLTHAATQTGVNGRVLTASNTSTNASNPTVSAPSSGTLTGNVTADDVVAAGTMTGGTPSALSGNVVVDDVVAAGTLSSIGPSTLTGDVTVADVLAAGSMGVTGTVVVPELRNWAGVLIANTTIPTVTVCRLMDGVQVLLYSNLVTSPGGDLSLIAAALVPGTWYMVAGWTSDGTQRFARPVLAV